MSLTYSSRCCFVPGMLSLCVPMMNIRGEKQPSFAPGGTAWAIIDEIQK